NPIPITGTVTNTGGDIAVSNFPASQTGGVPSPITQSSSGWIDSSHGAMTESGVFSLKLIPGHE
ncbi:MAG: hypothetical protein ACPH9R_05210, partial [Litorivicinaceae bacterium]